MAKYTQHLTLPVFFFAKLRRQASCFTMAKYTQHLKLPVFFSRNFCPLSRKVQEAVEPVCLVLYSHLCAFYQLLFTYLLSGVYFFLFTIFRSTNQFFISCFLLLFTQRDSRYTYIHIERDRNRHIDRHIERQIQTHTERHRQTPIERLERHIQTRIEKYTHTHIEGHINTQREIYTDTGRDRSQRTGEP